jgi:hypothetical protein
MTNYFLFVTSTINLFANLSIIKKIQKIKKLQIYKKSLILQNINSIFINLDTFLENIFKI